MAFETGETLTIPSPIDVHVHLREPGGEHKETIASGTYAALIGGYQAVFDMPNNPGQPTVNADRLIQKNLIASHFARTDIGFYVGVDFENPNFDELNRMFALGAAGLKLYMGHTTGNTGEHDLEIARPAIDPWILHTRVVGYKKPILLHAREGVGEETADYIASKGNPVHWCHVSTETEAEACKKLTKKYPDLFTAGVTPHHFTMTSVDADFKYGWNGGRMMPPLANEADHEKLVRYFNEGYIQILETDHAPHTHEEKLKAESENPEGHDDVGCSTCFGVSGIEFVLPIMMALVQRKITSLERLVDATHYQPIRMLGLNPAEIARSKTLLNIGPRVLTEADRAGQSSNHPYVGWTAWAEVLGFEVDDQQRSIENKPKEDVKILTGRR